MSLQGSATTGTGGEAFQTVRLGTEAGIRNTGPNNVYVGVSAGAVSVSGEGNAVVGAYALQQATDINNTVAIGSKAGQTAKRGGFNVLVGAGAGEVSEDISFNTFIGAYAGYQSASAIANVFCGYKAGEKNVVGDQNVFIGAETGQNNRSGNSNAFVGYRAGRNNTLGSLNTFVGSEAGAQNQVGSLNTFVGMNAGFWNKDGDRNTFVGFLAGYSNSGGDENVFVGREAGAQNRLGSFNTIIGSRGGSSITNGSNNVLVGFDSASLLQTGSGNIIVGSGANVFTESTTNSIIIGSETVYATDRSIVIGNNNINQKNSVLTIGFNINTNAQNSLGVGNKITITSGTLFTDPLSTLYTDLSLEEGGNLLGITAINYGGSLTVFESVFAQPVVNQENSLSNSSLGVYGESYYKDVTFLGAQALYGEGPNTVWGSNFEVTSNTFNVDIPAMGFYSNLNAWGSNTSNPVITLGVLHTASVPPIVSPNTIQYTNLYNLSNINLERLYQETTNPDNTELFFAVTKSPSNGVIVRQSNSNVLSIGPFADLSNAVYIPDHRKAQSHMDNFEITPLVLRKSTNNKYHGYALSNIQVSVNYLPEHKGAIVNGQVLFGESYTILSKDFYLLGSNLDLQLEITQLVNCELIFNGVKYTQTFIENQAQYNPDQFPIVVQSLTLNWYESLQNLGIDMYTRWNVSLTAFMQLFDPTSNIYIKTASLLQSLLDNLDAQIVYQRWIDLNQLYGLVSNTLTETQHTAYASVSDVGNGPELQAYYDISQLEPLTVDANKDAFFARMNEILLFYSLTSIEVYRTLYFGHKNIHDNYFNTNQLILPKIVDLEPGQLQIVPTGVLNANVETNLGTITIEVYPISSGPSSNIIVNDKIFSQMSCEVVIEPVSVDAKLIEYIPWMDTDQMGRIILYNPFKSFYNCRVLSIDPVPRVTTLNINTQKWLPNRNYHAPNAPISSNTSTFQEIVISTTTFDIYLYNQVTVLTIKKDFLTQNEISRVTTVQSSESTIPPRFYIEEITNIEYTYPLSEDENVIFDKNTYLVRNIYENGNLTTEYSDSIPPQKTETAWVWTESFATRHIYKGSNRVIDNLVQSKTITDYYSYETGALVYTTSNISVNTTIIKNEFIEALEDGPITKTITNFESLASIKEYIPSILTDLFHDTQPPITIYKGFNDNASVIWHPLKESSLYASNLNLGNLSLQPQSLRLSLSLFNPNFLNEPGATHLVVISSRNGFFIKDGAVTDFLNLAQWGTYGYQYTGDLHSSNMYDTIVCSLSYGDPTDPTTYFSKKFTLDFGLFVDTGPGIRQCFNKGLTSAVKSVQFPIYTNYNGSGIISIFNPEPSIGLSNTTFNGNGIVTLPITLQSDREILYNVATNTGVILLANQRLIIDVYNHDEFPETVEFSITGSGLDVAKLEIDLSSRPVLLDSFNESASNADIQYIITDISSNFYIGGQTKTLKLNWSEPSYSLVWTGVNNLELQVAGLYMGRLTSKKNTIVYNNSALAQNLLEFKSSIDTLEGGFYTGQQVGLRSSVALSNMIDQAGQIEMHIFLQNEGWNFDYYIFVQTQPDYGVFCKKSDGLPVTFWTSIESSNIVYQHNGSNLTLDSFALTISPSMYAPASMQYEIDVTVNVRLLPTIEVFKKTYFFTQPVGSSINFNSEIVGLNGFQLQPYSDLPAGLEFANNRLQIVSMDPIQETLPLEFTLTSNLLASRYRDDFVIPWIFNVNRIVHKNNFTDSIREYVISYDFEDGAIFDNSTVRISFQTLFETPLGPYNVGSIFKNELFEFFTGLRFFNEFSEEIYRVEVKSGTLSGVLFDNYQVISIDFAQGKTPIFYINDTPVTYTGPDGPCPSLTMIRKVELYSDSQQLVFNGTGFNTPSGISYDLKDICVVPRFQNFSILIAKDSGQETTDTNIAIGQRINIKGNNNICVGKDFLTSGNNSIIIGTEIGVDDSQGQTELNSIFESILIGSSSFRNTVVRNVVLIGNNNFNNMYGSLGNEAVASFFANGPIIIGNNIDSSMYKYYVNIGNTFMKSKEQIYVGRESEKVRIGCTEDIDTTSQLYVKGAIRATESIEGLRVMTISGSNSPIGTCVRYDGSLCSEDDPAVAGIVLKLEAYGSVILVIGGPLDISVPETCTPGALLSSGPTGQLKVQSPSNTRMAYTVAKALTPRDSITGKAKCMVLIG